jgi:transcriptional regulator with XRE-family HTH domain
VLDDFTLGQRLRSVRKRRGLTQSGLADLSGVSVSLIRKLEQDERQDTRLETLRKLAAALRVPTTTLIAEGSDAPVPGPASAAEWEQVRLALAGTAGAQSSQEPTLAGVTSAFREALPHLLAGRFAELGAVLPALLRDADALVAGSADVAGARSLRAQIRQAAGALMLHAWQFDTADRAFELAMSDADNRLTAMSVTEERCWGLIRQGRLSEARELAIQWADDNEPRITAGRNELAAWGRLLVRAAATAVRDNRASEARDALRLARMAAAGVGRDFILPYSPWHVFGPTVVAVAAAENAMIEDRPQETLDLARGIAGAKVPVPRFAPSHRLDVAHAHVALRQDAEAVGVLQQLRRERPQWLAQQRHASDVVQKIVQRRRTLTPEMRDLASFVRLPY